MRPSFYKLSSCPVSILSKTTRLLAQQKLPLLTSHSSIFYGTLPVLPPQLLDGIERKLHEARDALDRLKQQGDTVISPVTIRTILNGMRGSRLLVCETSEVSGRRGISYRGIPIQQLIEHMPGVEDYPGKLTYQVNSNGVYIGDSHSEESFGSFVKRIPLSEGLLWLFLTGEIPSHSLALLLRDELQKRMELPEYARRVIKATPSQLHPMAQFIIGVTACQKESRFANVYQTGSLNKNEFWKYVLEDGLSLIAKVPGIASLIYQRIKQRDVKVKSNSCSLEPLPVDFSVDWAGNIARGLGFDSQIMANVIRLYMFLHADHEGGNVSAHTAHLVGSALSDPFLSYAASMAGLAGPLHGLANQDCLNFLRKMHCHFQEKRCNPTDTLVEDYIREEYLKKGRVVPGFGHAVLRTVDPRFLIQQEFAKECIQGDPLADLLAMCARVVPPLLIKTGKVSNPYPNVDAHSGVILNHYGITEQTFFTVLFGVSRSLGVVSQLVWDRLLLFPIERPKSVTLEKLELLSRQETPTN